MHRLRLVVGLIVAAWLLAAPGPCGSQAIAPPVLEVTTVTRVVDVYATVRDRKGGLITSLGPDQFELFDDRVRQNLEYFARETDVPLSLGLLFDTSASQARLLATEREQAAAFLRRVVGPRDRAFVMQFDHEILLLQGLTDDISLVARAIDAVHASTDGGAAPVLSQRDRRGGTRLYDAIQEASDILAAQRGRKAFVLLTDGEDQGSQVTRRAAIEAAERAEVIAYSVLVADPLFYWARGRDFNGGTALKALQEKTGGWVRPEANEGLEEIAAELRAQYRLGYTPTPARYDGSFHRIEVRLRGVSYKVRARHGYYATAE